MDRGGFEPPTSALRRRRSSADLSARVVRRTSARSRTLPRDEPASFGSYLCTLEHARAELGLAVPAPVGIRFRIAADPGHGGSGPFNTGAPLIVRPSELLLAMGEVRTPPFGPASYTIDF